MNGSMILKDRENNPLLLTATEKEHLVNGIQATENQLKEVQLFLEKSQHSRSPIEDEINFLIEWLKGPVIPDEKFQAPLSEAMEDTAKVEAGKGNELKP